MKLISWQLFETFFFKKKQTAAHHVEFSVEGLFFFNLPLGRRRGGNKKVAPRSSSSSFFLGSFPLFLSSFPEEGG